MKYFPFINSYVPNHVKRNGKARTRTVCLRRLARRR